MLSIVVLAGCTRAPSDTRPTRVESDYGSTPPRTNELGPVGTGTRAGWDERGTTVALVALGSSTCPNLPQRVRFITPTRVSVTYYGQHIDPWSGEVTGATAIRRLPISTRRTSPLTSKLGSYGHIIVPARTS